jgi:hypothetical protein
MNALNRLFLLLLSLLLMAEGACAGYGPYSELDQSRIIQIERLLDRKPSGLGPICDDRQWWGSSLVQDRTTELRRSAETLLKKPFPAWDDGAYLDYSHTGSRLKGDWMMEARKAWLYPLVVAECVEYKGRFLPAIEKTLTELASQPAWNWPAADRNLRNFRDHDYEVDLLAADTAHELAQTLYMLGDKIPTAVRASVVQALNIRIFNPLRRSIKAESKDNGWLKTDDNWNAVCLKGSIGAALTVIDDRRDRALFAAAAEQFIKNYVFGFTEDGYTREGPEYWNYGFSHFVQLREILARATHGHIDLFNDEKVDAMAMYGFRIEMMPNNIAAFGDALPNVRIDDLTRAYTNQALQLGFSERLSALPIPVSQRPHDAPIFRAILSLLDQPASLGRTSTRFSTVDRFHSYFGSVGVLVSRPTSSERLAVTIKAGGNGNHSHNDIGSYTIGMGLEQPVGDVGAPRYTSKTFSRERYSIPSISSWGHPVPVVDGVLQSEADKLSPHVISTHFSDQRDEIMIDMAVAYKQPIIKSLTRDLVHQRGNGGQISIIDQFEYTRPGTFEVALTTLGRWRQDKDGSLDFWKANEHLRVNIDASAPWTMEAANSSAEGLTFTRLSIRLVNPSVSGYIKAVYSPYVTSTNIQ